MGRLKLHTSVIVNEKGCRRRRRRRVAVAVAVGVDIAVDTWQIILRICLT